MASNKRTVRVFSLLVIFMQLEVQVRSQQQQDPHHHQSGEQQFNFGAQEMFSSASQQDLMDEMFQRGEGVVRAAAATSETTEKTSPELVGNLIFQPSLLDFVERSIGDPHNQVVILINKHKSRSVVLGSISGSTPDFYSSYFKEMVIPPEGNTTFNVVFLPRQLGATAGSIEIHTSFGLLQYNVKGEGIECPYRLRPLVGLQAPLNATLTPEITLYNPHDTALQIVEIYSSGGSFQLELPSGAQEGPQALWEIPPHSTRSVIRVRFHGKTPGNHTAYVRIKISGGADEPTLIDKMLVVPIEIEIFKESGLYTKIPFLDLGVGGMKENITKLSVNLTNSGTTHFSILRWGAHFSDVELIHASKVHVTHSEPQMLHVEIDWSKIVADKKPIAGEFFIGYEPTNSITHEETNYRYHMIPFTGQVLKGNLKYDADVLKFLTSIDEPEQNAQLQQSRPLVVRNKFHVPLSISNITVPENCSRNFRVEGFRPKIIQPDQEETLLRMSRILTDNLNRSIATYIRLMTNVTDYDLPVYSYTGKLKRILPFSTTTFRPPSDYETLDLDERELNFGILPISTIGESLIAFFNENPVEIPIRHWKGAITSENSGSPTITVILRGCGPHTGENLIFCHTILPKHWIVFQISVQSSTIDSYQGKFSITTDYEEIVTPISFTTAVGKLELNRELLHFDDCFPGKLCSLNLTAHSTFVSKIHVEGIKTDVDGIEFTVESRHPVIHPNMVTNIGRLVFDPKVICKTDCYSSFDLLSKPFGVKWMATLDNYEQYRKLDSEKLLHQLRLYSEMRDSWKSIRFQLTTDPIRKFEFNATVDLVWPKLLTENIHFPTLQIEQEAVKLITINNPSDQILFVHLVLHDVGVHGSDLNALPPEILSKCANCSLSEENVFSFFLFDYDDIYVNYVKPKSFLKIAVKFTSKVPGTYSTIFYMRNNLTLIDAVWIQAKAVVPQFKFGNRKPGSSTALQFEITDKHLKMCSKLQEPGFDEPLFSIQTKRSFTARNYGEVPIAISGIRVEDILCEGYGFKVLDCSPFELQPNASKKIEIAFSPDFTLARVTRTLNFDTNINFPVNFTLLGSVPAHGLESCSLSLVRPWFESMLRMVLICVLSLAFLGTLTAAFLDANKVIRDHVITLSRDRGAVQPPLDLRQIALQSPISQEEHAPEKNPTTPASNNAKGNQNNSSKKKSTGKPNVKHSNGNTSGFNRTWNDFTSKFKGGFNSKQAEPASAQNKPSPPDVEKRPQKSRRSITPPKEEPSVLASISNNTSSSSAKERNIVSIEEDSSSTTTESSESSSTISTASTVLASQPLAMYRMPAVQVAAVESKASKGSVTTGANHHTQHAVSKSPTSDLKLESNSTGHANSINQNNSINNNHQQLSKANHQQLSSSSSSSSIKANVKKTKSLPSNYETGVSLSLGTSFVNINASSSSSSSSSSENANTGSKENGAGLRNASKNHSNEKGGPGKNTSKSAEKTREHSGKENGNAYGDYAGKNDSSQPKKFGKTPGRERKSNSQGKKGSGSKNIHKAQALQFGTPSSSSKSGTNSSSANFFLSSSNIPTAPAPPNVWGENRARFSDVVAQAALDTGKKASSVTNSSNVLGSSSAKLMSFDLHMPSERTLASGSAQQTEAMKLNANMFAKAKEDSYVTGTEKKSAPVTAGGSELGPIGTTKKSPSVTPNFWEPFCGSAIQRPTQLLPGGNDLTSSDSYFSQTFGDFNHGEQQYRGQSASRSHVDLQSQQSAFGGFNNAHGMEPSVNDLNSMMMDWDANKILWQMSHKNEEHNSSPLMDWSSLWTSPSVFAHQHQQHQQQSIQQPGSSGGRYMVQHRPSPMPLRAPPGFSPVKPNPNSLLAQVQQTHQQISGLQQQQPQQDNNVGSVGPAYDPFQLSSIWAPAGNNDVWNEKK